MDPYDLPEEFSHLQALDMSKLGFMQDLVRGIKKIIDSSQPKQEVKVTVAAPMQNTATNIAPLLKRAYMFLEDRDLNSANEYAERVLDTDPECAEAYLVKLLVDLGVPQKEALADFSMPFDNNKYYQKALRFAPVTLKNELLEYVACVNKNIKAKNEKIREESLNAIYLRAKELIGKQTYNRSNIEDLEDAIEELRSISDYKDSSNLIKTGEERIKEIRRILLAKAQRAKQEYETKQRKKKVLKTLIIMFSILWLVGLITQAYALSIISLFVVPVALFLFARIDNDD